MNGSTESLARPAETSRDALTDVLRDGAHQLLAQAIEAEVATWIENHKHLVDEDDHQAVVRNGHMPTRSIITGIGAVQVTQPRVHDRRIVGVNEDGQAIDERGQPVERFRSKILPPYLRKTKSMEELIPWLYLKGVSTGDFTEALQALLGPHATGLSATTITRLIILHTEISSGFAALFVNSAYLIKRLRSVPTISSVSSFKNARSRLAFEPLS